MKKQMVLLSFILLLFSSAFSEEIKYALGSKFLVILPGISGQAWFNEHIGLEGNVWPYGSTNSLFTAYQVSLLYQTNFARSANFFFGMGGYSYNSNPNASLVLTLGERFTHDKFTFAPILELGFGSNGAILLPSFAIHSHF